MVSWKQLFLVFSILYITGSCHFPENLSISITIKTYFFSLFSLLESEFTTTETSYCCILLLLLHIVSNCSGFYEVISELSYHTWNRISKIFDRCARVCSVHVFGHHETSFHTCSLSMTRIYRIGISGASLHTILSKSVLKIISIQICLLEKKRKRSKTEHNKYWLQNVFVGSVNIKLMKRI